jgi:hypothetical protein
MLEMSQTPAPADGIDHLDAETLELATVLIIDSADSNLNQTVRKPLFHDPGKG